MQRKELPGLVVVSMEIYRLAMVDLKSYAPPRWFSAIFFAFWFAAVFFGVQALNGAESKRTGSGSFLRDCFLLLVFPIGLWLIQARLNRLQHLK